MALPYFSAVPAIAVPAQFTIAFTGQGGLSYYKYIGHQSLYYLDYLDLVTGRTLYAVPGGIYAILPVNSRQGLSEPPPDSWRWNPQSSQLGYGVILRRHIEAPPSPEVLALDALRNEKDAFARARMRNTSIQAVNARKPYWQASGGTPKIIKKTEIPLSVASAVMADARALNANLQAQMARGEKVGC